jgi:hypothetical protein
MIKSYLLAAVVMAAFGLQESNAQSITNGSFNPIPGTFSGPGGSLSGGFAYTAPGTVVSIDLPTTSNLPLETRLDGNYPNPFNPSTVIGYQLSVAGTVRLAVYDVLGREVAVLVNQERSAGRYQVPFNASALSSGVYLYQMQLNGEVVTTRRMTLVK